MAAITVAVAQLAGVTNSRDTLLGTLEEQYRAAGAHFVLRSASDLLPVLDEINARLANE